MIAIILLVVFLVWLVGPLICELSGLNKKDNLDVYEAYVKLERQKKYAKSWKKID